MKDGWFTAGGILLLLIGVALGMAIKEANTESDCRRMGQFRIGDTAYTCTQVVMP